MVQNSSRPMLNTLSKLLVATLVRDQGNLAQWLSAPHRSARNVARDAFRHPGEVLAFFDRRERPLHAQIREADEKLKRAVEEGKAHA
jgi:hypothetical protein